MASIAVVGAGAVGCVVALRLMQSGAHSVSVAARAPIDGIEVTYADSLLRASPRVILSPAEGEPQDWVLVATKAYDAAGAAEWFSAMVGPRTTVAILQNGVEHRHRFAPYLTEHQILPVVVDLPAERSSPGKVTQGAAGLLTVAKTSAGRRFSMLFDGTGIPVEEVDDFATAAWRKLCLNAVGAVSALALRPDIDAHDGEVAALVREVVRETVRVGNAEGASLDDQLAEEIISGMQSSEQHGVNSMLADRLAGRPMEVDARNGAVVRFGEIHGIPTPVNRTLVGLLRAASATA